MDKFCGEFDELERRVTGLGYKGQWEDDNAKKVFRSEDKAVLNWWPSTGTLQAQGPTMPRSKLEKALSNALSSDPSASGIPAPTASVTTVEGPSQPTVQANSFSGEPQKVFVVYGHDEIAREQLELVLHRLNLEPFVLGNTARAAV